MNELLDEVLAAHGGLDRWQSVTDMTVRGTFSGLLQSRFPGNRLANLTAHIRMSSQHVVLDDFPHADQRAVFDHGDVRIETSDGDEISGRPNARAAFAGLGKVRRNVRWDAHDATYFAGYALWNYLSTPVTLTRDEIAVSEGEPWNEAGQRWRTVEVTFPSGFHTHSPHQRFYVDDDGLIRRHDYAAQLVGRWATAAHYLHDHQRFTGLVIPTRRRVQPRGPRRRPISRPVMVAIDIDNVEVTVDPADGVRTEPRVQP